VKGLQTPIVKINNPESKAKELGKKLELKEEKIPN
jgi:hypothetical protein